MNRKVMLGIIAGIVAANAFVANAFAAGTQNNADALNYLGLFQGTDNGYELDKSLTRAEAVTMIVRYLGAEKEAESKAYDVPFTDMSDWAKKYIGYAYSNGITKGTSDTEFSPNESVSINQYLTFLLRVLGYDDSKGDFLWSEPYSLAKEKGIIGDEYNTDSFKRSDMVDISWNALSAANKDNTMNISELLIGKGVFTSAEFTTAKSIAKNGREVALKNNPNKTGKGPGGSSAVRPSSGSNSSQETVEQEVSYKVSFSDENENIVNEQLLKRGEDAIPPKMSNKPGQIFLGWSHSFYDIMGDTQTKARYISDQENNIFCMQPVETTGGQQFQVVLDLTGTVSVCAYDMHLKYDPDILSLEDIETNPTMDLIYESFDDKGEIKFNMVFTKNLKTPGNIMTLTFTAKDADAKSTTICLEPQEVLFADEQDDFEPKECEYNVGDCVVHIE